MKALVTGAGGLLASHLIAALARACARLPHAFDDSKARRELGNVSRPAVVALEEAARTALRAC
jgi:nucleoside-diphosphate-sugar epimerase